MSRADALYCSFCRRHEDAVDQLIGGPGVQICDACVAICSRILSGKPAPGFPGWAALSDRALLDTLAPSCAAVDATRDVLQRHVGLLRERGISWSAIGDALGISRQAAWERFA